MSVRDRIAGFGGSGAAGLGGNRGAPAWATQQRLHSAKPMMDPGGGAAVADFVKTSSGVSALGASKQDPAPVRRLKVPDIFQNTTKPADGPVHAVAPQSSFPPKKCKANGTASTASGAASGRRPSGLGPSMVETKSRSPPARPVTTSPSSSGAFHACTVLFNSIRVHHLLLPCDQQCSQASDTTRSPLGHGIIPGRFAQRGYRKLQQMVLHQQVGI